MFYTEGALLGFTVTNKYNDFRVTMNAGAPGQVSTALGKGAVASASRQASELAIQVLQDGGNAFDAAFATAFSLCIYQPQAGNLGGGGYLLFQEKGGRPQAFNYREQAPRDAKREAYLLPDGSPDPDKTAFGPASVCVPGTVKAFFELQKRYGNLKAKDLLLVVARRAEEGAVLTQYEADCLNRLAPKLAASPEARRIYVRAEPYRAGDILPNPALAQTLTVLAQEGEQAFYRGRIAEQIVADLQANGGFMTAEDLAGYALREVEPIHLDVAGRQVWTVPPEGGGALLLEILGILDRAAFRRW
ncbi:MAG: gamma-glutamyltransferase, partial [Geothrix sp.]|nr:gamma-glutamyltransferase [Geothrix sp.]